MARRLALVVNSRTSGELKAGHHDVSRVFGLLTRSQLGACDLASPPPLHGCPNYSAFHQALHAMLADWKNEDQLVFYFSGHGNVLNGVYCLQFGEAQTENVPFANILQSLRAFGVSRSVIVLDACHSGGALTEKSDSSSPLSPVPDGTIPQGIAILVSSRLTQKSYELTEEAGSVFTKLFCDGIETGLDGSATDDGFVAVGDIIDYITKKLQKDPYARYPQSPMYKVNHADRSIWVARNISKKREQVAVAQGSTFLRNVDELRLAYETTIRSKHPCQGASVADIDWDLIDLYIERSKEAVAAGTSRDADTLRRLGMFSPLSYGEPALHNAAALCFSVRPEKHTPQARSVFVAGTPSGKAFKRIDVYGPLSLQVKQLVELVQSHVETISVFDGGLRQEEPDIPLDLVREVISNAIVHRDYGLSGTVRIWLTQHALEVRSPGRFPDGITWDALLAEDHGSSPVDAAIVLYVTNTLASEGIGRGFGVIRQHVAQRGREAIRCVVANNPPSIAVHIMRRTRVGARDAHTAQPTPDYPNSEVRALSEALAAAQHRKSALLERGADTTEATRDVLELRRRLREGGRLREGDSLGDGRYVLLNMLGRGGFATVWRAHDRVDHQQVAVKVLHSQFGNDPLRRERFFRGARTMARLAHEAIARVLLAEGEDDGFFYFVIELIRGGDLRHATLEHRLPRPQVVPLVLQVGSALAAAHSHGFVHRDVKPANILLAEDGSPRLTDFDLVGGMDTTGGTRTGALGTFVYAAPEMMERPQDADARTDIYSLAMTTLFCLYGSELPMNAIFRDTAEFISRVAPGRLGEVLAQAVQLSPEERFADMNTFCAALKRTAEGS
ncbi:MAG: protein kinase [Polyangiaceae bacterium]|nr:protein kinase [Polyangiaceae bacterium]